VLGAQVGFLDTRIFGEGLAVAGQGNPSDLEHVGTMADFKGQAGVLLD
jgi:hypothetical protein